MGFLAGKRALIVGVASPRSIAWGIGEAMHEQGAQLAFTYQTDKLKSRVESIAEATGSGIVLPCDVGSDEQIQAVFAELGRHWDGYDILVHSVGFAPYFKSLKGIVHFYNARDVKDVCPDDYTEAQGLAADCWPQPEVAENVNVDELGNLGLTDDEENAIVAFLEALTDGFTP